MRLQGVGFLAAAALAAATFGCSSEKAGPTYGGEDGRKIAQLVELVNDEKSTSPNLARLFTKGSAPKDLRQYATYAFEVEGNPAVAGTTATAKIKMTKEGVGADAGKSSDREWTFEKEGEAWKIKTAPLP